MITQEIDYHQPTTIKEAMLLLRDGPDETKIIAGGMSLVPMMTLGLVAPERLVSLRRVKELVGIKEERKALVVGAMTPHYQVATHELVRLHAPLLAETAHLIGDVQVRNRGTIGGSFCIPSDNASGDP